MRDVVVIGAGLAGLAAAIKAADSGLSVTLVTKGVGGIQLGTGTVDILGYRPEPVEAPLEALEGHVASRPTHPYSHVTPDFVGASVAWLRDLVGSDVLIGDETRNVRIPTGVGALRPTCLIPPSMEAGIPQAGARYAIVGLTRFKDFYPGLVAENLTRQNGPDGAPIKAPCPVRRLCRARGEVDSTGTNHARSLDHEDNRTRLAGQIRPLLEDGEIVGLPAVLGLDDANAWRDLADKLGHPVFEIPIQPPSVPGMRLNALLTRIASDKCRVSSDPRSRPCTRQTDESAQSNTPARDAPPSWKPDPSSWPPAASNPAPSTWTPTAPCERPSAGCPSWAPPDSSCTPTSGGAGPAPSSWPGLAVDDNMRVLNEEGAPVCPNLYAAGGNLAGATRWREKSGEGIALASALAAVDSIVEELK